MALSIYSLLMLFLITTRWKWNLGCFGAALRTDSMRWKRISGNTTEASFCFNFQAHTGLQFPGVRKNCNWRKAHWKHIESVSFQSSKAMSPRAIAVMPLNQTLLLKATVWQSKSLSSQAFWILNDLWAQTGAQAVAPWNTFYSQDPQPLSFCPSVHQSVPSVLSLGYSKPHFSGCFSGLLMAPQADPQLKGAQGLYPALGVTLLTLLWVASFLKFMSPHLQLGGVPGWGGGMNTR